MFLLHEGGPGGALNGRSVGHPQLRTVDLAIRFPRLLRGPFTADPRLPCSREWLLNLVITRGTPPRLEGCRPASRGL